jgi:integrase
VELGDRRGRQALAGRLRPLIRIRKPIGSNHLGGPLRESKFVPGYFKPAVAAVGLPSTLRFYDLRHTAASLLIREGASVKAVQKQLGHATASITLDTYGHLFPDELDALAGRLEDLHGRALAARRAADVWPRGGPAVVALHEGAGQ